MMPNFHTRIVIKIVVDIVLLLLSGLPVLLFYTLGKPFKRGFACDDTSIKFPYKNSTVSAAALYIVGTLIPLISILVIEYYHAFRGRTSIKGSRLNVWFWSVYCYIGAFLFGCAMSHTIVDICKYSVGRLRPHFLEVCKPANLDLCEVDPFAMVNEDLCTVETDPKLMKRQKESRLSFMSGHASFSMFTMIYLVLYLQERFHLPHFPLVKPILQQVCFVIALYTGLSRVMDYKHHWSDIFAGFINGFIFAVLIGIFVAKFSEKKKSPQETEKTENVLQDNQV